MAGMKYFRLWADSLVALDALDYEDIGVLFYAIRLMIDGDIEGAEGLVECNTVVHMAFIPFLQQYYRDMASYNRACMKNAENEESKESDTG